MADDQSQEDRTEEPTQHRLDEALKRGDVVKSAEISTFLALGALMLGLSVAGAVSARNLALDMRAFLMNPHLLPGGPDAMMWAGRKAVMSTLWAVGPIAGLLFVAAIAAGLIQHRPVWSFDPLMPKFDRLSPMAGLKRIMGPQALGNFGKGLLKILIVGALSVWLLWGEHNRVEALVGMAPADIMGAVFGLALKLLGLVLAAHAVLAGGDYVMARFSWMRRQRMTKHELKEEMRNQDGNPEIKAKLRQIRVLRLRKRMMAAVPQATVIVTNPTHYAVALKYEKGQAAPICVAKGVDELALRIRSVATEHNVPIVENPPLARALHASVQIDDEIPVEHYKAVAEVIGFVLRLKRRAS
ncbi:MAG: flhB [Enterovirga sp.]|jgi:flagellar biosynthetic protein FlhB|nr:flhB [Enterovirga sp.]